MSIDPASAQTRQDELTALEATIGRGLASYRDVGQALAEIKARKLYRCTEHKTWAGYCKSRWDMSVRHADRQIDVAGVARDLERHRLTVPLRLRAALPLIHLVERQRCEVWRAALAAAVPGRQPTSSVVEALAARALGKPLSNGTAIAALVPAGRPRQLALLAMNLARAREQAVSLEDGRHLVDLVERAEELVARMPTMVSAATA